MFYVANSKIIDKCPSHLIPILINAGRAFGTGEHATTKGCLNMLSQIKKEPRKILDVGTGSGVLAIAAKKLWPKAEIIGTDIDEIALEVARENSKINNAEINFRVSYDVKEELNNYDLILSNILAKPLIGMSADFYNMLSLNGLIIISGFIERQMEEVSNTYNSKGFILASLEADEEWRILSFAKN